MTFSFPSDTNLQLFTQALYELELEYEVYPRCGIVLVQEGEELAVTDLAREFSGYREDR